ncbi:MAG: hypothetical protein ACXW3Z_14230, partial [Limisphaerales bacterium]
MFVSIVATAVNGYNATMTRRVITLGVLFFVSISVLAAPLKDVALQKYFEAEVARIETGALAD